MSSWIVGNMKLTGDGHGLWKNRLYSRVNNGNLDGAARSEVLETAKEIMKVKNPIAVNQVFDFSLIEDAR
jgi:hypothetical protein